MPAQKGRMRAMLFVIIARQTPHPQPKPAMPKSVLLGLIVLGNLHHHGILLLAWHKKPPTSTPPLSSSMTACRFFMHQNTKIRLIFTIRRFGYLWHNPFITDHHFLAKAQKCLPYLQTTFIKLLFLKKYDIFHYL